MVKVTCYRVTVHLSYIKLGLAYLLTPAAGESVKSITFSLHFDVAGTLFDCNFPPTTDT